MLHFIYRYLTGGGNVFRKMRRHDKAMAREEALELLKNGEYGILSVIGDDGYPYGIPLNYAYKNNQIYFHCALEGYKIDAIKNNNKVSFCIVGNTEVIPDKFSTKYESVIVFGRAEKVIEENEKKAGLLSIIEKYSFDYKDEGKKYINKDYEKAALYRIAIEHMTGKKANE
jgi:nitroimidazol reductase NimA-like FMN-containing flavoprotein (pyridoxamine 5'-phosphate oxidase superfamily)